MSDIFTSLSESCVYIQDVNWLQ